MDPKLFWFGIIDASLGLDASEGGNHLPRALRGRCYFCELMELLKLYVFEQTYVVPFGRPFVVLNGREGRADTPSRVWGVPMWQWFPFPRVPWADR